MEVKGTITTIFKLFDIMKLPTKFLGKILKNFFLVTSTMQFIGLGKNYLTSITSHPI